MRFPTRVLVCMLLVVCAGLSHGEGQQQPDKDQPFHNGVGRFYEFPPHADRCNAPPITADDFQAMSHAEQIVESIWRLNRSTMTRERRQDMVQRMEVALAKAEASRIGQPEVKPGTVLKSVQTRSVGQLRAGAAWRDITPPIGAPSAGYGDRLGASTDPKADPYDYATAYQSMQGKRDPLRAKAIVLDNGTDELVFLGVDAIASSQFVENIATELQNRGLPFTPEQIIVSATHTHHGPGAVSSIVFWQFFTVDFFDQRLYDRLVDGAASAIEEAYNTRVDAKIATVIEDRDGISRNRRGDPGNYDRELAVTRIDRLDDTPLAVMFNYAVHPTCVSSGELYFTADFCGFAERLIEKTLGNDCVAMFTNAAEGDVSPAAGGFMGARQIGTTLAQWTLDVRSNIPASAMSTTADLRSSTRVFRLPPPYIRIGLFEPSLPLNLTVEIGGILGEESRFTAFRVNDTMFTTLPGEPITDVGRLVKDWGNQNGFAKTVVLGLGIEHFAYFCTESEYWQGGYEAGLSFFGPETGRLMAGYATDVADDIATP